MTFRIVGCPNCYYMQITEASIRGRFKCLRCGKTKNVKDLKVYFKTHNGHECGEVFRRMKEQDSKDKGNYSEEFKSLI